MRYKLLAVDMDGTLLNEDSVVTERTRKAVLAAMDSGVLFVPSTGRPLYGVDWLGDVFPGDLPLILYNGALAMTSRTKQVLFSQMLPARRAQEICAQGVARGYPVVLWENERLHVSEDCEATRAYRDITGADMHLLGDVAGLEGISKVLWIIPPGDGPRCQAEMQALLGGEANCHTSQSHFIEFVVAGASKGKALEALGAAYGIAREEMVAVGDGWNDASMLEYAGLGVAMGNAPEEIKALCDAVTLGNHEDGVAAVIERYILQ